MLETFCQVNYHFFGNISKLTTWFMEINLWMNVLVHLESPSLDFVVIVLWKLKDWIAAGSFSAGLKLFCEVFIWCEVSKESKVAHLGPSRPPVAGKWHMSQVFIGKCKFVRQSKLHTSFSISTWVCYTSHLFFSLNSLN